LHPHCGGERIDEIGKSVLPISRVPLINGATHFMAKLITFAQVVHRGTSELL
jgi:hypothetical protein